MSQNGSGLVETRATISETVFLRTSKKPKQMDTARNRGFSGTQKRQGPRASSCKPGSPSSPKTRWVTGAGLKNPAQRKRKSGCATEPSRTKCKERCSDNWDPNRRASNENGTAITVHCFQRCSVTSHRGVGIRKRGAKKKLNGVVFSLDDSF